MSIGTKANGYKLTKEKLEGHKHNPKALEKIITSVNSGNCDDPLNLLEKAKSYLARCKSVAS